MWLVAVQKRIYLAEGNKLGEYNPEAYQRFAARMGWYNNLLERWLSKDEVIDIVNKNKSPQKGILPTWEGDTDLDKWLRFIERYWDLGERHYLADWLREDTSNVPTKYTSSVQRYVFSRCDL